ncbi:L,D-transpeptidase family protein [Nonomuraea sp. NPDC048826]|uniref:L,D-transpeptidase family protein n=1 Tax=Nonomuraea sp. NPDC048826 TaxID=3364347 RepID=UPI0037188B2D
MTAPAAATTAWHDGPVTGVQQQSGRRPILRQGSKGAAVLDVQRRLSALGYWMGAADGMFGPLTTQAVYALQKSAGLARDGVVGPATWAALTARVRPAAGTRSGKVVEVDLRRQVLLLVRDGRVQRVFNTSTGSGRTYSVGGVIKRAVTPSGTFRVRRQVNGWDKGPLGSLYRPRYFNGGIAVHGYGSVPPYAASHGCVRVSVSAMDWLWSQSWLKVGDVVVVR